MLNNEQIAKLEELGCNHWQKGNYDRVYINMLDLPCVDVRFYKTGNISGSAIFGERVSHKRAAKILSTKIFIDVNTEKLHIQKSWDYSDEYIDRIVDYIKTEIIAQCL